MNRHGCWTFRAGRPIAIIITALTAALILVCIGCADDSDAASGTIPDTNIEWKTELHTLTITSTESEKIPDYDDQNRPPWPTEGIKKVVVNGKIKGIGECVFKDMTSLEEVSLGYNLREIGDGAFDGCGNVKRIDVDSKKLDGVGDKAIQGLTGLTEVNFSENVQLIPVVAKFGKDIQTITIPATAQDIAAGAFAHVTGLKKLVFLPLDMNRIINAYVFDSDATFTCEFASGIRAIPQYLFAYCNFTEFTIPDTVVDIRDGAFTWAGLKTMNIPEGVTRIGFFAFEDCWSLETVTIPSTVNEMDSNCFGNCYGLKQVYYYPSGTTLSYYRVFDYDEGKPVGFTIYCGEGSVIPGGLLDGSRCISLVFDGDKILDGAFGEYSLTFTDTIVFGENIEYITNDSFSTFRFYDADHQPMDLTPDSVRGHTFIQGSPQHYTMETYGANAAEDDSEALKAPAMGLSVLVAVIAACMILSFARRK